MKTFVQESQTFQISVRISNGARVTSLGVDCSTEDFNRLHEKVLETATLVTKAAFFGEDAHVKAQEYWAEIEAARENAVWTQILPEQIAGREVQNFEFSNSGQVLIAFKDKTFIVLSVRKHGAGWGETHSRIESTELNLLEFGDEQINRVGIATLGRLSKLRSRAAAQRISERESGERIELARLKAKYES